MSQDLQAQYSRNIKGKQRAKRKEDAVARISKLPSGKIASRSLRGRGNRRDEQ